MISRSLSALALALAVPAAAPAAQVREPSLAERYVRVTAANAAGDLETAAAEMGALLARRPDDPTIALRAYRQALQAGDHPLATRAAQTLVRLNALPADGPLLLAVDAIAARDWKGARAQAAKLEEGKLFAFLVPMLRAWIALGAGDGDPLAALEPARTAGIAQAYYPEQHALLLLASGRTEQGAAEVGKLPMASVRLKLLAAAALARRDQAGALTLLAGEEQPLVAARARLGEGRKLVAPIERPNDGLAELLVRVATDFNRQRLAPIATGMARIATFAAPDNAGAWLVTAQVFALARRPAIALAALDHVPAADPFGEVAREMRVALLVDSGERERALAEVLAVARRPGAVAADWARAGDVLLSVERQSEAAAAYDKAIALLGPSAPPQQLWQLWLQAGTAYEFAGDWAKARPALEKAYALAPDQPAVLNHLGYSLLARREELPRATELIARASKLRPDDPAITDSLGWSQFVGGKPGEAAAILERAVAGDPGEPTINEHLGDTYWTLGRRLEARYAWRAALVTAEEKDAPRIRTKIADGLSEATAAP